MANTEPLLTEIEHFLECIETRQTPRTDGKFGADVVAAIEMATQTSWQPEKPVLQEREILTAGGVR